MVMDHSGRYCVADVSNDENKMIYIVIFLKYEQKVLNELRM